MATESPRHALLQAPEECILYIFSFLDAWDLCLGVSLSCKGWKSLIDDHSDQLWKDLYHSYFGGMLRSRLLQYYGDIKPTSSTYKTAFSFRKQASAHGVYMSTIPMVVYNVSITKSDPLVPTSSVGDYTVFSYVLDFNNNAMVFSHISRWIYFDCIELKLICSNERSTTAIATSTSTSNQLQQHLIGNTQKGTKFRKIDRVLVVAHKVPRAVLDRIYFNKSTHADQLLSKYPSAVIQDLVFELNSEHVISINERKEPFRSLGEFINMTTNDANTIRNISHYTIQDIVFPAAIVPPHQRQANPSTEPFRQLPSEFSVVREQQLIASATAVMPSLLTVVPSTSVATKKRTRLEFEDSESITSSASCEQLRALHYDRPCSGYICMTCATRDLQHHSISAPEDDNPSEKLEFMQLASLTHTVCSVCAANCHASHELVWISHSLSINCHCFKMPCASSTGVAKRHCSDDSLTIEMGTDDSELEANTCSTLPVIRQILKSDTSDDKLLTVSSAALLSRYLKTIPDIPTPSFHELQSPQSNIDKLLKGEYTPSSISSSAFASTGADSADGDSSVPELATCNTEGEPLIRVKESKAYEMAQTLVTMLSGARATGTMYNFEVWREHVVLQINSAWIDSRVYTRLPKSIINRSTLQSSASDAMIPLEQVEQHLMVNDLHINFNGTFKRGENECNIIGSVMISTSQPFDTPFITWTALSSEPEPYAFSGHLIGHDFTGWWKMISGRVGKLTIAFEKSEEFIERITENAVRTLMQHSASISDKANAANCIAALCEDDSSAPTVISCRGIDALCACMEPKVFDVTIHKACAKAIWGAFSTDAVVDYAVKNPEAVITPIVKLLIGTSHDEIRQYCLSAIRVMLSNEQAAITLAHRCGALKPIMELFQRLRTHKTLSYTFMNVLWSIAIPAENKSLFARYDDETHCISFIVNMLTKYDQPPRLPVKILNLIVGMLACLAVDSRVRKSIIDAGLHRLLLKIAHNHYYEQYQAIIASNMTRAASRSIIRRAANAETPNHDIDLTQHKTTFSSMFVIMFLLSELMLYEKDIADTVCAERIRVESEYVQYYQNHAQLSGAEMDNVDDEFDDDAEDDNNIDVEEEAAEVNDINLADAGDDVVMNSTRDVDMNTDQKYVDVDVLYYLTRFATETPLECNVCQTEFTWYEAEIRQFMNFGHTQYAEVALMRLWILAHLCKRHSKINSDDCHKYRLMIAKLGGLELLGSLAHFENPTIRVFMEFIFEKISLATQRERQQH